MVSLEVCDFIAIELLAACYGWVSCLQVVGDLVQQAESEDSSDPSSLCQRYRLHAPPESFSLALSLLRAWRS